MLHTKIVQNKEVPGNCPRQLPLKTDYLLQFASKSIVNYNSYQSIIYYCRERSKEDEKYSAGCSGKWICDEHIILAQHILKMQFPNIGGFQSPLLCQNDALIPVQNGETIRIRRYIHA